MREEENAVVVKGGTLIDGTGAEPVENAVVVILGSKITAVGEAGEVEVPDEARVVDATGKTVMPGLIDSHLHLMGMKTDNFIAESLIVPDGVKLLRASKDVGLLLDAGFTTVKDCGGTNALHLKRAIAERTLRGPRILAAGYALSQTFGHGDTHFLPIEMSDVRTAHGRGMGLICDGVEECTKAARYALREGADFIKVCTTGGVMSERDSPENTQFNLDEIRAIVQVAHHAGTFVTAHCQGTEGMRNSIDGGIKTIDHAFYPDDYCIEMGKKRGVVFVSTLSIMKRINEGGVEAGYPPWGVRKSRAAWDKVVKNIARLREAGATVAAATDFCGSKLMRQGTNALELELLVKHCGFTPMDAIVSATLNGARACGLEARIGTIEKGKLADVLVVDGDPLRDVTLLQNPDRIEMVMKEGVIEVERSR